MGTRRREGLEPANDVDLLLAVRGVEEAVADQGARGLVLERDLERGLVVWRHLCVFRREWKAHFLQRMVSSQIGFR